MRFIKYLRMDKGSVLKTVNVLEETIKYHEGNKTVGGSSLS